MWLVSPLSWRHWFHLVPTSRRSIAHAVPSHIPINKQSVSSSWARRPEHMKLHMCARAAATMTWLLVPMCSCTLAMCHETWNEARRKALPLPFHPVFTLDHISTRRLNTKTQKPEKQLGRHHRPKWSCLLVCILQEVGDAVPRERELQIRIELIWFEYTYWKVWTSKLGITRESNKKKLISSVNFKPWTHYARCQVYRRSFGYRGRP